METVEIVIRIPKKYLDQKKAIWNSLFGSTMLKETDIAILSGTVLPKGHGRLIDVDKFIDTLFTYGQADDKFKLGERIKYTPSEIWEITKILAETVIEADKEE